MKIMFNTMTLNKGGAERVINILSNSLVEKNDVMILTNIYSTPDYEFNSKIRIKSLVKKNHILSKITRKISIIRLLRLKKIIVDYKPDIIISFLPESSFRVLTLKKYCKKIKSIPVIVSVRNDPNTEYKNKLFFFIMKRLYPYANQLVLQTDDSKKYFKEKINYEGLVIKNPVSDIFLTKPYSGERDNRIVAVGRLVPQKNYMNMIDAFKIVSEEFHNVTLNIYGEGFLKEKIQKYIDKNNLNDKVFLLGKVNNIKDEIFTARVFVMSSNYEGMPNSLLEAACLGVPCVSTDCPCGGPREILDNGKCGVLVEVNNSENLANGIRTILNDKNKAKTISIIANEKAHEYSKKIIIEKWIKCIDETKKCK